MSHSETSGSPEPQLPPYLSGVSTPVRTGALSYALGFLAFIPIPFLSLVIAGVVMASVYPGQRKWGGIARENARRAGNWGLTVSVLVLLSILLPLIGGPATNGTGNGAAVAVAFAVVIIAIAIAHLVVIISGVVVARSGQVYRNPVAIPFLR